MKATESLEPRFLLANAVLLPGGTLQITGDNTAEQLDVCFGGLSTRFVRVSLNALEREFRTADVQRVQVNTAAGNDVAWIGLLVLGGDDALDVTVRGGTGNDQLTEAGRHVNLDGGHDPLVAGSRDERLDGGAGGNRILDS
jgi:hypothetical protein